METMSEDAAVVQQAIQIGSVHLGIIKRMDRPVRQIIRDEKEEIRTVCMFWVRAK